MVRGRDEPVSLPALPALPDGDAVVVLVGADAEALVEATPWRRARRVVIEASELAHAHDRLSRLERVDGVVDCRSSAGADQVRLWRELFLHLEPGGTWVARRDPPGSAPEGRLVQVLTRICERRRAVARRGAGWHALASAVAGVEVGDDLVLVEKRHRHLLKVRDAVATSLLTDREPGLDVTEVATRPGGTLVPAGRTWHHGIDADAARARGLPDVLPYPATTARRYDGPVVLSTAHARHGRSLLPESFRWHLGTDPTSTGLREGGPQHARLKSDRPDPPLLRGSYYNLDYSNTGHYGHLMTEAISRLWAWREAKAVDQDLKILLRMHPVRKAGTWYRPEMTLLPALGIEADDIVWFDRDARVESLVGTTPMWHNASPHYVHPAIREVWTRARDGLVPNAPTGPERIFVTRHEGTRLCRNVDHVEALFAALGFAIVRPGQLRMPEQAATFAGARVVAGFGGTGMFNLAFANRLETVIVLNHTAYDARNEHLFAAALGADLHLFWSDPDLAHPEGGFSGVAFQSAWEFDVRRLEATVRSVAAGLG